MPTYQITTVDLDQDNNYIPGSEIVRFVNAAFPPKLGDMQESTVMKRIVMVVELYQIKS